MKTNSLFHAHCFAGAVDFSISSHAVDGSPDSHDGSVGSVIRAVRHSNATFQQRPLWIVGFEPLAAQGRLIVGGQFVGETRLARYQDSQIGHFPQGVLRRQYGNMVEVVTMVLPGALS